MNRVSKSQLIKEWLEEDPSRMEGVGASKRVCKKFKASESAFYAAKRQIVQGTKPAEQFPKRDLEQDIKILKTIGLERVRTILDLM